MFPGKLKQSKSDEFFHDFDLYSAPHGNGQPSSLCSELPDIFDTANVTHSTSSRLHRTKTDENQRAEKRIHEVTKKLISIHKRKRMQVFHGMAEIVASKRSKEFLLIYSNPSEAMRLRRQRKLSKFHAQLRKPKKPFSYQMEYEKLRGLKESEEELAKVQAYIDKMIAKNIKKMEEEKRKKELTMKKVEYHYPTLLELVSSKFTKQQQKKVQFSFRSQTVNFLSTKIKLFFNNFSSTENTKFFPSP